MFKAFDSDLLNMKGYEALNESIKVWETIQQNMVTDVSDAKVFLPNYFWVADPGTPVLELVRIFSEKLFHMGIMPFSNSRLSIEFVLEYNENEALFHAFQRLYNLLEHGLSQYGEPFAGVLMIDISEWIERDACGETRFERFLDYLTIRDDIQMIILYTECTKSIYVKRAEAMIASRLRIRTIKIQHPEAETFLQKVVDIVGKLSLTIDEDAQKILLETIRKAMRKRGFNGLFTIKALAKEIIYEKYRRPHCESNTIRVEDITDFTPNGRWVDQLASHLREG